MSKSDFWEALDIFQNILNLYVITMFSFFFTLSNPFHVTSSLSSSQIHDLFLFNWYCYTHTPYVHINI